MKDSIFKSILLPAAAAAFSYDRAGGMTSAVTTTGGTTVSEAYSFSWPRPVSLTRSGGGSPAATFGFSYDGLGRMTSDALSGTGVAYNTLDLPSRVTDSAGNVLADYSYTASGTKVDALDASGNGLLYRGPFVYRKGSGGVAVLESAVVPEGRITPSGALLHVRDHLGSVRAVVDGSSGTVVKASAYSAYGSPSGVTAGAFVPGTVPAGVTLRDAFSGKEDQQPDFGVPWLDFGARAYSPSLRRWMVPDPLGEKYYGVNPYAYCSGDPVNYVDPEGRDIWEIDELGQLKYHTKDDNSDTFYIVDKNGNRTDKHISFDYGTINKTNSIESAKLSFAIASESTGAQLFKFLADNTSVEFGFISTLSDKSLVFTDQQNSAINIIGPAIAITKGGETVTTTIHSHPGNGMPSGFDKPEEDGDRMAVSHLEYSNGFRIFHYVYQPKYSSLILYDSNGYEIYGMPWDFLYH